MQALRANGLVALVLAFSALVNIALGYRVLKLGRQVAPMRAAISFLSAEDSSIVGSTVPPLNGRTITGAAYTLNYSDSVVPTVLYVFSPECPWCERNLPNLRLLAEHSGPRFDLVGVSLDSTGLARYLANEQLDFPVIADVPDATKIVYGFGSTPETLVISRGGKVLKIWKGAYHGSVVQDIGSYLGVALRECCESPGEKSPAAAGSSHTTPVSVE